MGSRRVHGKVGPMRATVTGLFVYPVKGCAGVALTSARVLERGLEHDRHWMVVTPAGRFLTQRELPALARVRPTVDASSSLRLSLPDGTDLPLPPGDQGEPLRVRVWRDEVDALAPSPEVDAALTRHLGRPVRLVRFPDTTRRACDEPEFAPEGSHTAFADGYPILVTSEGSLDELNAALLERDAALVPMTRFRPNIVLAGLPTRAEDHAPRLRFEGGLELLLVKPCDRCAVTTVDQETGERVGPEPISTLKRIRRNPRTGGVVFGQNAVAALPGGGADRVTVGEGCELLSD
jgi:uncharacterized protein YcbX